MLPHEVSKLEATTQLSLDHGIHVVLIGLPPVYAHGLRIGLTAIGLRCTVQPVIGELAPQIEPGSTGVAVLPAGGSATVTTGDGVPMPVVLVVTEASVQAYSDALQVGATGAFALDAELGDIVRIVVCAGLGLTLLPVEVARAVNRRSVGRRPQLTDRDRQYLRMLADGATVASVGRRFGLSEREVYRLLSATYQRLGARSRTEALLLAERSGLLDEGV